MTGAASLKQSLRASLGAEAESVQDRFARAAQAMKPQSAPALCPERVVREGVSMPERDFALLLALRDRCLSPGLAPHKSEIVRAGLHQLAALDDAQLRTAVTSVERLKTGGAAQAAQRTAQESV